MIQFSVVMPLYNKASFLPGSVGSVLAQSCADFELVIVDDGSTDDGAQWVQTAIVDPRVRLIRTQNRGVSSARNLGVRESRGEIICFIDADDCWSPCFLEEIAALFSQFADVVFAGTGYWQFRDSDNISTVLKNTPRAANSELERVADFYSRWESTPFVFTSSIAVKASALRQLEQWFAVGVSASEDQDVWFRLCESSSFAYSPARLAGYRREVSNSLSSKPVQTTLYAYQQLENRLRAGQVPEHLVSGATRLLLKHRFDLLVDSASAGRKQAAWKILRTTFARMSANRLLRAAAVIILPAPLSRLGRQLYKLASSVAWKVRLNRQRKVVAAHD